MVELGKEEHLGKAWESRTNKIILFKKHAMEIKCDHHELKCWKVVSDARLLYFNAGKI